MKDVPRNSGAGCVRQDCIYLDTCGSGICLMTWGLVGCGALVSEAEVKVISGLWVETLFSGFDFSL